MPSSPRRPAGGSASASASSSVSSSYHTPNAASYDAAVGFMPRVSLHSCSFDFTVITCAETMNDVQDWIC